MARTLPLAAAFDFKTDPSLLKSVVEILIGGFSAANGHAMNQFPAISENHLLARLPRQDYQQFLSRLELVPLKVQQVLYQARSRIDYVYFPTRGGASVLTLMEDGRVIEVATIGNEGVVGLSAFLGDDSSPHQVIMQVAGEALRIEARLLHDGLNLNGHLHNLLQVYQRALLTQVSQSAACHGLHTVRQRCCRWLLMLHDRAQVPELGLTHEFLAMMMGVRRPSVTEVLGPLQAEGLVRSTRGKIAILNRAGLEAASCECYRAVADEFARLFATYPVQGNGSM